MKITRREPIVLLKTNLTQKPLRVAAYCRVSSSKEAQLSSLDAQINYYASYIKKNPNWTLVGIFSDKKSGKTMSRRPGFCEMFEECRKGNIDCIITKSVKRFSRNTVVLLEACRELRSLDIDVIFEIEKIKLSQLNSEQVLTILAGFAQAEIQNMSENIRFGLRQSFNDSDSLFAFRPCYGYRRKNNGLSISEREARVVRKIFRLRLKGYSIDKICRELEQSCIKAPNKGSKWSASTVSYILSNEKYIGDVLLGKTYVKDFLDGKQYVNTGQRDRFIENVKLSVRLELENSNFTDSFLLLRKMTKIQISSFQPQPAT